MRVQTEDYLDAITHLPPGGRLTLYEIGWEEYERLLDRLGEGAHRRISYDNGRLEIMTPSDKHEKYKNLLHDLVLILSDELDQEVLSYGSTTLKLEPKRKGAEGDDCFYIQHAMQIGGKDRLDLSSDPPPDLVIEIDLTHDSSSKFAIYAALGVPEIWHYDGQEMTIYHLQEADYVSAETSRALPMLSSRVLTEYLKRMEQDGEFNTILAFDEWLQSLPR